METHADAEKRLAGRDVLLKGFEIASFREGGETVSEVANAREDDFLVGVS